MTTKTTLVEELAKRDSVGLKEVIEKALRGEYHDFESSHATPKVLLVDTLKALGYPDLALRVMQGEFDE